MNNIILAIEYDKEKRPFTVWTKDTCYAVEHSKSHGAFYYDVGSGLCDNELIVYGPGVFWGAEGIDIHTENDKAITRLANPVHSVCEDGVSISTMNVLARHLDMEETNGSIYCRICDDYMPDGPEDECEHIFWSVNWGDYGGCGVCHSDADCEHYKKPFLALVEALGCPPEDLISDLRRGTVNTVITVSMLWQSISLTINGKDYSRQLEHALTELRGSTYEGYGWLYCLEPGKTDDDIKRTIGWLRGKNGRFQKLPDSQNNE